MTNALGNRMKEYENVSRIYLPRRMPVIIRVDGRAFHTLTRGFQRPFDKVLHEAMCATANLLCHGIVMKGIVMHCRFGEYLFFLPCAGLLLR